MPVALGRSERLGDHDAIESPDMNDSPPTEVPVNAEIQLTPESDGTQIATQGTAHCLRFW